ncbi:MAG: LSU ribosomal protein L28p @ LSU ribosomal protein L28p, zinc-dependent, partial [uncultured Solirubrobacteraceae bacterium]
GSHVSLLRKAPCLRAEPLALHGRHQATFRCQPPEGPHRGRRGSAPCVRLHALPQGRQGHQVL